MLKSSKMPKWDHLVESDERLRSLERQLQSGDKSVMQAYAREFRSSTKFASLMKLMKLGRRKLKARLRIPDKAPPSMDGNYELEGIEFVLNRSFGGAHRLKVKCPICGNLIGPNMGKMGQHLKRADHHGENIDKVKGEPPKHVGRAMYKHVRTKKYGIVNLYPDALVGYSGGQIAVWINNKDSREKLDEWMLEKYGLSRMDVTQTHWSPVREGKILNVYRRKRT